MNSVARHRPRMLTRPPGAGPLEGSSGALKGTKSRHEDIELVKKSQEGDKDSYRRLVEKYESRAFLIALEIVRSREDAEDVVQEAFVKAFLSLGDFKGEASFYTWFYRIVYNMAIDFRRRIARRGGETREFDEAKEASETFFPMAGGNPLQTPHEAFYRKEQARRIQEVLGELSEEHRTVVILREIEGMSYDEIASTVCISRGTVMSRLHYARKKLQQALKDMAPATSTKAEDDEQPGGPPEAGMNDELARKNKVRGRRYG